MLFHLVSKNMKFFAISSFVYKKTQSPFSPFIFWVVCFAQRYLEPWHADVYDFIELRKNHGKEEQRARDLFLGLWIPDLFMKRVKENQDPNIFCEWKNLWEKPVLPKLFLLFVVFLVFT